VTNARPPQPAARPGVISEFVAGFVVLVRGFSTWRRHPGLMALGFVPAAIVGAAIVALLTLVAINVYGIGAGIVRPFSHHWHPVWQEIAAYSAGAVVLALVGVLGVFAFTALSLLLGEPIYTRIWRAVEQDLGGDPPSHEPGFWRTVGDSARIVVQTVLAAIGVGLIAAIPFLGPPLAAVGGVLITGRLVALELTARPLEARGMTRTQRAHVLRSRNPRLIGFGVAVHLCFAVPFGAVIVMPAAVAGATILARIAVDSLEATTDQDSKRPVSD
jgi:CysZ protein